MSESTTLEAPKTPETPPVTLEMDGIPIQLAPDAQSWAPPPLDEPETPPADITPPPPVTPESDVPPVGDQPPVPPTDNTPPQPRIIRELEQIVVSTVEGMEGLDPFAAIDIALSKSAIDPVEARRLRQSLTARENQRVKQEADDALLKDAMEKGIPGLQAGIEAEVSVAVEHEVETSIAEGRDFSLDAVKSAVKAIVAKRLEDFTPVMEPVFRRKDLDDMRAIAQLPEMAPYMAVDPSEMGSPSDAILHLINGAMSRGRDLERSGADSTLSTTLKAEHQAEIAKLEEKHLADMNRLRAQRGMPAVGNGVPADTGNGVMTPAQYQAKLAAGETVPQADIDRMTAAYANA